MFTYTRGGRRATLSMLPQFGNALLMSATCSMFSLKVLFGVADRDLSQIDLYLEFHLQSVSCVRSEMKLESNHLTTRLLLPLHSSGNVSVHVCEWVRDLHGSAETHCVVVFTPHISVPVPAPYYLLMSYKPMMSPQGSQLFYKCNERLWISSRPTCFSTGGEIALWSLFETRCQPKLAARCRFMDRFTWRG